MRLKAWFWLPLAASAVLWLPAGASGGETAAAPSRDARVWLERIRSAAKTGNYQGTMVFTAGESVSSSRVAHFCVGDQIYERIEALDGRQQRIYRHNDVVHTLWPGGRVATVEQRHALTEPLGMPVVEPRLQQQYEVQVLAGERLAGRDAQVLMLKPRDGLRFAQRLWTDSATGLMLRADVLAPDGRMLESVAFSDIEIGTKPQRELVLGPMKKLDGYRVVSLKPSPARLEDAGWELGALPAGFELVGCVRRGIGEPAQIANGSAPEALQAVFSDGLARVSVFIEAFDAARSRQPMMTQTGATHALMKQHEARWWVTVMGDVPPMTLKQFVTALQRRP